MFVPHRVASVGYGCGTSALRILGVDEIVPPKVTPHQLILRLREYGCTATELRNFNTYGNILKKPHEAICPSHVILALAWWKRNEASWIVIYKHRWYHGDESYNLNPYWILNMAIIRSFIISHPQWKRQRQPLHSVKATECVTTEQQTAAVIYARQKELLGIVFDN